MARPTAPGPQIGGNESFVQIEMKENKASSHLLSLPLSSFNPSIFPPSTFLLLSLFALSIFTTCVCLRNILLFCTFEFLYLFTFFCSCLLLSHHALLPLHLLLSLSCSLARSASSPKSIHPPSFSASVFIVFPRHSRVTFCPYLTPSNSLFTFTHVLICSLLLLVLRDVYACVCVYLRSDGSGGVLRVACVVWIN